jgi:hypothetical protein
VATSVQEVTKVQFVLRELGAFEGKVDHRTKVLISQSDCNVVDQAGMNLRHAALGNQQPTRRLPKTTSVLDFWCGGSSLGAGR